MALTKVTSGMVNPDPSDASNLSSGDVPLAQLGNAPETDLTPLEDDIALIGFKVAANGSLAKYDLVDQTIDDFQDASGIDASASTNESRDSSGKYYSGTAVGSGATTAFTSTGATTWTAPSPSPDTVEVLVVAGGGGGSSDHRGPGGGAGGIVHDTDYAIVAGTVHDLTVGTYGGGGGGSSTGTGEDSVWNINAEGSGIAFTAKGGGHGGTGTATHNGGDGGSGGGAFEDGAGATHTGGDSIQADFSGATSYGNEGGDAPDESGGAGGGGASAAGQTTSGMSQGGYGGAGQLFSTWVAYGTDSSNVASTGSNGGYFGGGGGGGGYTTGGGAAGVGGGGRGAEYNPNRAADPGIANTGGGGGGKAHDGTSAQNGGTGFIGIHYAAFSNYLNMTLVSNSTTAESTPTKGDFVMTYTDGVGTATINTDLKAYVSRDNGTTYTQGTLVSQGTTGGHTILTFQDLDISSQPSGTAMRYKIETLNQSVSKSTRIQAVSLGWS